MRRRGRHFITNLHQHLGAETTCFPAILHPPGRPPADAKGPTVVVVVIVNVGVRMSCMEGTPTTSTKQTTSWYTHTYMGAYIAVSLESIKLNGVQPTRQSTVKRPFLGTEAAGIRTSLPVLTTGKMRKGNENVSS